MSLSSQYSEKENYIWLSAFATIWAIGGSIAPQAQESLPVSLLISNSVGLENKPDESKDGPWIEDIGRARVVETDRDRVTDGGDDDGAGMSSLSGAILSVQVATIHERWIGGTLTSSKQNTAFDHGFARRVVTAGKVQARNAQSQM